MSKLLLHTCCAPCSIAIIGELKAKFDLTVFFYNPNIYPEEEYLKRKKYVIQICDEWKIPMVDADYEVEKWKEAVKGLENEPEGGRRCEKCFKLRLERTAEYAKEHSFDVFSTSLTSGRNKKAEIINPIGEELGEKYGIEYYPEDWKKNGRQELARKMIEERGIYRQNYCGCIYSTPKRSEGAIQT